MHTPAPSPGERPSYLYLLLSRECPDRIKMGITDSLSARITTLQNIFGGLNLGASWLVRASSRHEAVGLERTLKYLYGYALNWRAEPPRARTPGAASNGHDEWYQFRALTPMLGSIGHVIEHCGKREHLFPSQGVPAPTAPLQDNTREERQLLRQQREEQRAREQMAESEAGFQFMRRWFATRSERLLVAGAPEEDHRGVLRREFTFQRGGLLNGECLPWSDGRGEWDALWLPGILRCHTAEGTRLATTYLSEIAFGDDGRTFTVGFAFGEAFRRPAERFVPNSLLPQQIREWVATV